MFAVKHDFLLFTVFCANKREFYVVEKDNATFSRSKLNVSMNKLTAVSILFIDLGH